MPKEAALLVSTNLPDQATAQHMAQTLIEQRLAACVSTLPSCRSVYRWRGVIEAADEIPLLIKTTQQCYPALEAAIRALHPYELPEIIAVPIVAGLPAYLTWIATETAPPAPTPP